VNNKENYKAIKAAYEAASAAHDAARAAHGAAQDAYGAAQDAYYASVVSTYDFYEAFVLASEAYDAARNEGEPK